MRRLLISMVFMPAYCNAGCQRMQPPDELTPPLDTFTLAPP
jgi:hypothetical protein